MTRHIDLDGIENFRDFGGYGTRCGRGLKPGLLYRSANHAKASETALEALRERGVRVIVDLRRPVERQREPSRRWPGFDGLVIENDIDGGYIDWADALKAVDEIGARWFFEDSLEFYEKAPFEARHVDLFSRYFRTLADTDGAILIHCAAGKDRTGILCALTHHIAGVHRDDTLADYLLTNDEARTQRRMATFGPWLQELTGRAVSDDALRTALTVDEQYLDRALASIHQAQGSLDGYLETVLGIDAGLRARIESRILG